MTINKNVSEHLETKLTDDNEHEHSKKTLTLFAVWLTITIIIAYT